MNSVSDHFCRRIRAAYYAFGPRLPGSEWLGRRVHAWEVAKGFGDSPKSVETWNREYGSGAWNYMRAPAEVSRCYAVIGYMDGLRGEGAFLDVGCGDGVLYERFRPHGYTRYVGIDISEVAVSKLARFKDERTSFEQADGDVYEPRERFDVIVFNESLYYLRDPIRSLRRYAEALKPDGAVVISTYTSSRRSTAVLRDAKRTLNPVDETKTTQGGQSWLCTVLRRS